MGEIADSLIDGEFDYITGEYLGPGVGYPRTHTGNNKRSKKAIKADEKIRAIRKELAILIQEKQKDCKTEKEKNIALDLARREINTKYGKGWRENYEDLNLII